MFERIIRVITNNPTKISKPIFTKEFDKENKQIKDLEKLLEKAEGNSKTYIENDIRKLKYGAIGENNIYYELKNSFIPMICLHDIRIEYKGFVAQIDFVIITTKYIYVIESKNLMGDIEITPKGEFIRNKKNTTDGTIEKEGMYSPIVQNERHINVLTELLKDKLGYKHKLDRIESLVVIANPKTIINNTNAPKEISEKIIRYDQLVNVITNIEKDKKIDWVFIEKDMMSISDCLIKNHKEKKIDYIKKYSLNKNTSYTRPKIINKDNIREKLKEFRTKTSKEENIKPYMVFNNATMEEILIYMPKSISDLKLIKGFGEIKAKRYGNEILNIIKNEA